MSIEKYNIVFDIVTDVVSDAMESIGENWDDLSFCNGAEVFESDITVDSLNSQTKEVA